MAIKVAGVSVVVASSFARIFYRNAINTGLPIVVCPAAAADAKMGDRLKVDLAAGTVENLTQGKTYDVRGVPAVHAGAHRPRRPAAVREVPDRRRERIVTTPAEPARLPRHDPARRRRRAGDRRRRQAGARRRRREVRLPARLRGRRHGRLRHRPVRHAHGRRAHRALQGDRRRAARRRRRPQVGHHRPAQAASRAGSARHAQGRSSSSPTCARSRASRRWRTTARSSPR